MSLTYLKIIENAKDNSAEFRRTPASEKELEAPECLDSVYHFNKHLIHQKCVKRL